MGDAGDMVFLFMRPSRNYVLWDDREHLFLVEMPIWSAGVWSQNLSKAEKFSKAGVDHVLETYPGMKLKAMTIKAAKTMLSKGTYVMRRII